MKLFSIIVIPLFILFVVFYGYIKKVDVYSSFLEGAKEGMKIVYNIFCAIKVHISIRTGRAYCRDRFSL